MNRETRNALQALVCDLESLAAGLRNIIDEATLIQLCDTCERVMVALNEEPTDPS